VGFAPIPRAGVNDCVIEPSLVAMTGTQNYATKPIAILSQDTTQVNSVLSSPRRTLTPVYPHLSLICDHFDRQIISSEDFETSEQAQSWLFAATELGSSLNLGVDSPEVSRTFEVPVDSSEITLEFDFYKNDDLGN
jgi:hypothetical protein